MNTVNIVLMMILSVMIGFAIGNICGKESMKRTISESIRQMLKGIETMTGKAKANDEKKEE